MRNKMRRRKILHMAQWIPDSVVLTVIPKSTILIVLDEPDFVRGVGTKLIEFTIVGDEGFEFPTKSVTLDPVGPVTTILALPSRKGVVNRATYMKAPKLAPPATARSVST
jgi:hypothetical protein